MTTKIQWTQDTWNPLAGCFIVSPGCKNCYAMRDAHRLAHNPNPKVAAKYAGTTKLVKGKPVWTGKIGIAGDTAFLKPLRTKKPTMFFVNSMSDLFHGNVPDEVIDRIFAVMALCPQHTFQVLTKRSARMREYFTQADGFGRWGYIEHHARKLADVPDGLTLATFGGKNLPNVWLGVSVEDQTRADQRIPDLLATPAAIRFISAEPLLGPINLTNLGGGCWSETWDAMKGEHWVAGAGSINSSTHTAPRLDWVIVGGESGKGARPMHPDWARQIRDQCAAAGVSYFFKQWGAYLPAGQMMADGRLWAPLSGNSVHAAPSLAGRLLDGVEHNAMPERG